MEAAGLNGPGPVMGGRDGDRVAPAGTRVGVAIGAVGEARAAIANRSRPP